MQADTFDVVVVGGGPGGIAAAAGAAEAGGRVALLEVTETLGGNSNLSTGYLTLVDTPFQCEHRVQDSLETFMRDGEKQFALEAENGGLMWDRALTELFVSGCAAMYDELAGIGVHFSRLLAKPSQHSVDRLHAIDDPADIGRCYTKRLEQLGVTVFYRTEARRLVMTDGSVTGVDVVQSTGAGSETLRLAALKGVVLATGGYQGNFELRRRYQPASQIGTHIVGLTTCRGTGHVLGQSAGGDLINMSYIQPMVLIPSLLAENAIAVNAHGRRFHDETGKYAARVKALGEQPDQLGHYVIDAATRHERHDLVERMPEPPVERQTLDELADVIGCDAANLRTAVAEWNAFLASDGQKDPVAGRTIFPEGRRPIAEAPFTAMRMVRGTSFTWGGLAVTLDMQVVNVMGEPVAGLFAAGDTVGGINVISGMGGLHIAPALVLGKVAGRAAVAGPSARPHLLAPGESKDFAKSSGMKVVLFDLAEKNPDRSLGFQPASAN
jgi:succinate dehydrogenase/fumarate reductase flavoprotein subunit